MAVLNSYIAGERSEQIGSEKQTYPLSPGKAASLPFAPTSMFRLVREFRSIRP
jgi:hypothetical protein